MCNFLSFNVDKTGKVYALLGEKRHEVIMAGENPDSHDYISKIFNLDPDSVWKYEIEIKEPPKNSDELFERLHEGYDGGLPENELPYSVLLSIKDWLKKNIELIRAEVIQKDIVNIILETVSQSPEEGILFIFKTPIALLERFVEKSTKRGKITKLNGITLYYSDDENTISDTWLIKLRIHNRAIIENNTPQIIQEPRLIINSVSKKIEY